MKRLSTLLLLVATVAAGLIAYSVSRQPGAGSSTRPLLPGFRTEDVTGITIEAEGGRVTCRRSPDGWRMAEPWETRAQDWRLNALLEAAASAKRRSYISLPDGAASLADYGLANPRRAVTFHTGDGHRRIRIGDPTPAGDLVYVAVEGDEGVIVADAAVAAASRLRPADLRSPYLLPPRPFRSVQAVEVCVTNPPGARELPPRTAAERTEKGWEMTAPVRDLASAEAIQALLDALEQVKLAPAAFEVSLSAEQAIETPQVTIRRKVDGGQHALDLARLPDGRQWVARLQEETALGLVPSQAVENALDAVARIRERELLSFSPAAVGHIRIRRADSELNLVCVGEGWRIGSRDGPRADTAMVGALLDELANAQVLRFVDWSAGHAEASSAAAVRIDLEDAEGAPLGALVLQRQLNGSDRLLARRPPYTGLLAVAGDCALLRVFGDRSVWRSRLLLEMPRGHAIEIVLENREGRFRCVRRGADWRLAEPVEGPADLWAVQDILGVFANLRAQKFAAEAKPVAQPAARATVMYGHPNGNTVTHTLEVYGTGGGAFYATLDNGDEAFLLAESRARHLHRSLAGKVVCAEEEIRRLELTGPEGATAAFAYDASADVWSGSGGGALSQARSRALARTARLLEELRARRVEDYISHDDRRYGFHDPYLVVRVDTETAAGKAIVIGSRTDGGRYARGPVSSYVLVVSDEDVADLARVLNETN